MTDAQILKEFDLYLWLNERLSVNTRIGYLTDIKKLLSYFLGKQNPFFAIKMTNTCHTSDLLLNYISNTTLLLHITSLELSTYFEEHLHINPLNKCLRRYLSSLRKIFRYILEEEYRIDDPAAALRIHLPIHHSIPRVLSEANVIAMINASNTLTVNGIRGNAILELLYATGLRVSELIGLTLYQINFERGSIRVIGKGDKERLIPVGEYAIDAITRYINEVRSKFTTCHDTIFLNDKGGLMTKSGVLAQVKYYAKKAGLKNVTTHDFRHAFATHMMNRGADIRVIQMLLGHSSLTTTQIYTHVSKARLKKIHAKYHPRA